jgi:hypothetical protein
LIWAAAVALFALAQPSLRAQAQLHEFLFAGDRPVLYVVQRDDPLAAGAKLYVLARADGTFLESDDRDVLHLTDAAGQPLSAGALVLSREPAGQGLKFEFSSSNIQVSLAAVDGRFRTGFMTADGAIVHFSFGSAFVELAETLAANQSNVPVATEVPGTGANAPQKPKPKNNDVETAMAADRDLSKPNATAGLTDAVKAVLEDPETLNALLESNIETSSGLRFLKDVHLQFKTFDSGDGDPALGVAYQYDTGTRAKSISGENGHWWTTVSFDATGNIAFGNQLNPSDFLNTSLSLDFFGSWGGFYAAPKSKAAGGLAWDATDAEAQSWFDANPEFQKFSKDLIAASEYTTVEELDKSPEWRSVYAFVQKRTSTQYYLDASLHAALESNQTFTERNSVAGGHLGFEVKAYDRDSAWATANIFDYPFAALRWLTGYDQEFSVRGSNWPSVLLSLDHVAPEGNDPRSQAGDTSDYDRTRAEVSFTAPVGRYQGSDVKFSANYRYYHELGASAAVQSADLAAYDYAAFTLATEQGLFVSYATGHLPFDDGDQNYLELGFKTQL